MNSSGSGQRGRTRLVAGVAILVAWIVGLVILVRREYFRPQLERLAEAALRVAPAAVFYGVTQGDRQIGFASSVIDTTEASITVDDYLVADLPLGGKARRASARTKVTLSRALRMQHFDLALETAGTPVAATGTMEGDSVLVLAIAAGSAKPDTQRIALPGPILLPTLVPLAVALGERPKIGKRYVLPLFDPATMRPRDVGIAVRAESLFVVNDSSVYDSTAARWRGIQPDTLRAWQLASEGSGGFSGWIDEQGRIVETTQLGLVLRRMPYEVAFENWRAEAVQDTAITKDRDILEITAIAANRHLSNRIKQLHVRLSGVSLAGFDLDGARQRLVGDTLTVQSEAPPALTASYVLPLGGWRLDAAHTRPEPLVQSSAPAIRRLAGQLRGTLTDPRSVAERINRWVADSVRDRVTFGVPNALEVLRSRVGDCNEHTQLFLALARAAGIPARAAAGLVYIDGKFYYHAWPEILLGTWVAVDPTFGQFPADAGHLRFVVGNLARQTDIFRLIGNLKVVVLGAQ